LSTTVEMRAVVQKDDVMLLEGRGTARKNVILIHSMATTGIA